MKRTLKFILIPLICTVTVSVLFAVVALIPQSAIQKNASLSAEQLLAQPQWPTVINKNDPTYMLDNYTDSQILMQSYNLTISNPKSIFSNPKHVSSVNSQNMALALDEVVNKGAESERSYVYYWMGFRAAIRPLLLFSSYNGIRKFVAFLFWTFLFIALLGVAKKANVKTAVCLAIAIALMNPAIISQSLQFSCLYLLSSIFLIYLCYFKKDSIPVTVVFCAFGTLTQIFDFYTTPIITFGLPILVWYAIEKDMATRQRLSTGAKCLLSWGWGYALTWGLKLLFATCFTGMNAFATGFKSFAGRTGITVVESLADKYDAVEALKLVWKNVFPGTFGKILLCFTALAVLTLAVLIYLKKGIQQLLDCSFPLFVAAVPVIWYIIAAQPTVIHHWFQYRSLSVLVLGVMLFALKSFGILYLGGFKRNEL